MRAKKVVTSIYKVVGQMFIAASSGFSDMDLGLITDQVSKKLRAVVTICSLLFVTLEQSDL